MATGYQGYGNNPQSRRKSIWFLGHEYTWNERLQEYVRWFTSSGGSAVAIKLSDEKKRVVNCLNLALNDEKGKPLSDVAKRNLQKLIQQYSDPKYSDPPPKNSKQELRKNENSSSNKNSESKSKGPEPKAPDPNEAKQTLKDALGLERMSEKYGDPKYAEVAQKLKKKVRDSFKKNSKPEPQKSEKEPESYAQKKKQLDALLAANVDPSYGVQTIDDIHTAEEVFSVPEDYFPAYPDWDKEYATKALEAGYVTVYFSGNIKAGTHVSPSYIPAKAMAGGDYVFTKRVPVTSIAWIDGAEGLFCPEYEYENVIFSVQTNTFKHDFSGIEYNVDNLMKTATFSDFIEVKSAFTKWHDSFKDKIEAKEPKREDFTNDVSYNFARMDWRRERDRLNDFANSFSDLLTNCLDSKIAADHKYQNVPVVWKVPALGVTFNEHEKIKQKDLLQHDVDSLQQAANELAGAAKKMSLEIASKEPSRDDFFARSSYRAAKQAWEENAAVSVAFFKRVGEALAKAIKEQSEHPMPQAYDVPTNFPENPESLKYVKSLGGSTGAELVEAEDGTRYVRKRGNNEGHIRNECQVDGFYRAHGIAVPEFRLYETKNGPVKLSRYLEGAQTLDDWWNNADQDARDAMKKELRKGFAADIILGNWDVVGLEADNILIDKVGKPWRIDNGGALCYRAQGAQKSYEQWGDGFIDDLWTMTGNGERIGVNVHSRLPTYFGSLDVGEMAREIDEQDWKDALSYLSEGQRAIVKNRLKEVHQLAAREKDFSSNGYVRDYTLAILDQTYKFSKKGLREACAFTCDFKTDDYGWFRTSGGIRFDVLDASNAQQMKDDLKMAIKVINKSFSPGGDFSPRMSAVYAATTWKSNLQKAVKQGYKGAQYYLDVVEQIEDAVHDKKTIPHTNFSRSVTGFDRPASSLSQFLRKEIGNEAVDFIEDCNSSQGGNSYRFCITDPDCTGDACRMKILRLRAQGYDLDRYSLFSKLHDDATNDGYYLGEKGSFNGHYNNISQAFDYYRTFKDEYDRDYAYMIQYNAGIQIALENASFDYNDKATRSLILGRTESKKLIPNLDQMSSGDICSHKTGVNESHSISRTCMAHGDTVLTMVRVPYSRINGLFMMESHNGSMFFGDDEYEIAADTHGLPKYLMNDGSLQLESLDGYLPLFEQAEKNNQP